MTDFIGGPAAGKTLFLHRQPIYLRVVVNAAGEVMRSSERWAEWTEGEYAKSEGHS